MDKTSYKAMTIFGDKLYQQRARKALPILVRQAQARKKNILFRYKSRT